MSTATARGCCSSRNPRPALAVPVDGTVLANLLADQVSLRLVVLNSCKGARTSLQDAYAGIATTLVGLGVPAVVAMQFEISDEAAVVFAEELYTNLIGQQAPIDVAVAEARKAVLAGIGNGEWATPVLFVQDPDVALFDFRPRRRDGAAPSHPPVPPRGPSALVAAVAAGLVRCSWRPPVVVARRRRRTPRPAPSSATTTTAQAPRAAPTNGTTVPTPLVQFPSLTLGDSGLVVQAAQLLLRTNSAEIDATGDIDEATAAAIRAFDRPGDPPAEPSSAR